MATLFQYIDALCQKKPIDEDEETFNREYSQFMINKFFSCDRTLAPIANLMNDRDITNRMHFDAMWQIVPKGKRFIKYNAKKQKADKEIQHLMKWFGVNQNDAKAMYRLISPDEVKLIVQFYEKHGKR